MMTSTDRDFREEPWTVSELIEELKTMSGDSLIEFTSFAGMLVPKGFSSRGENRVSLDLDPFDLIEDPVGLNEDAGGPPERTPS